MVRFILRQCSSLRTSSLPMAHGRTGNRHGHLPGEFHPHSYRVTSCRTRIRGVENLKQLRNRIKGTGKFQKCKRRETQIFTSSSKQLLTIQNYPKKFVTELQIQRGAIASGRYNSGRILCSSANEKSVPVAYTWRGESQEV